MSRKDAFCLKKPDVSLDGAADQAADLAAARSKGSRAAK